MPGVSRRTFCREASHGAAGLCAMPYGATGHQGCGAHAGHGSSHPARRLDAVAGSGIGVRPIARAAAGAEVDTLPSACRTNGRIGARPGTGLGGEATRLLEQAVVQSPEDPAILSALGYNEQRRKLIDKAREHYEHALRIDPLAGEAAADLAVIEANAGHLERAIELWKGAFERAPARSSLGLNLTRGLC